MSENTVPTNDDNQHTLAAWPAPAWATRSRAEGGEVCHWRDGDAVPVLPELLGDPEGSIAPTAYLCDEIAVDDDGVRVVRDDQPIIILEGFRLTLAAAHNLGVALCNLVEDVEAMGGYEVTR